MLNSLEKREANRDTRPSCLITKNPDYITELNRVLEEADPEAREALRLAREMFYE